MVHQLTPEQARLLELSHAVPPDRVARVPVYPFPRDRKERGGPPAGLPGAGSVIDGGGGFTGCEELGGTVVTLAALTVPAATDVIVSEAIPRAFIIRHVELLHNAAGVPTFDARVKISSDNSTAGGLNATGQHLETFSGINVRLFMGAALKAESYPNFKVIAHDQFIKAMLRNDGVANLEWMFVVDIEFLD